MLVQGWRNIFQIGGLTSDFNWLGGGGREGAEETLLFVSLYFFGKIGGWRSPATLALPSQWSCVGTKTVKPRERTLRARVNLLLGVWQV